MVLPDTKAQFDGGASVLLRDPSVEEVVCATDAGREGELIFRYLYEKAGCRKPVQPALAVLADARSDPPGVPPARGRAGISTRSPTRPAAAAAPTGSSA